MRNLFGKLGLLAAATGCALLLATSAEASSIVVNGDFETGDFTGWTLGGNTGFTSVTGGAYVHSGSFGVAFGAVGSETDLSQVLSTTAGYTYDVTFWLRNDGGSPNHFQILWNGVSYFELTNAPGSAFTQFSITNLLATAGTSTLTVLARQDPAWWGFDDVSVTAAVPEPTSILLMGSGLLAVARFARRRRA